MIYPNGISPFFNNRRYSFLLLSRARFLNESYTKSYSNNPIISPNTGCPYFNNRRYSFLLLSRARFLN